MVKTDPTDGVDCVRFQMISEKNAPLGDYNPVDGTIKMNLDEIWSYVEDNEFTNPEDVLITKFIDVYMHEMSHKWFVWGMGEAWSESFNEQDERAMRVISDWVNFGKEKTFIQYDW